jgi:hypothetical protein
VTLEHRSPLKPGRVYHRKFDHDEARSLLASGWTRAAVARRMGVSEARILQISSPEERAKAQRRSVEFHAAICDDCGGPCSHNWSSKHGRHDRVVCRKCDGLRRSEDRLLERMNEDGDILCSGCGQHLHPAEFLPTTRTGMPKSTCRACGSRQRREYREAHREADRAYQRDRKRRIAAERKDTA